MTFKIIFTADQHGNMTQYEKIFKKAEEENVNAIIFGGDMTPKDPKRRTIEYQKLFLEKELFPLIKKFNKNLKHNCKIFLLLGNDDLRANEKYLKSQEKIGFTVIHNLAVDLNSEYRIIGYSIIPITPFKFKDWEKVDVKDVHENTYRKGFITRGIKTDSGKIENTCINLSQRDNNIENDLEKIFKQKNINKKNILVSHSPPFNTCLDIINSGEHVGSIGIRRTIEKYKPVISFHGHIHETVEMSKSFKEKIKNTITCTSGNTHTTETVNLVSVDLDNLSTLKREII